MDDEQAKRDLIIDLMRRGYSYEPDWQTASGVAAPPCEYNPLHAFFKARTHGRGIWKWDHYFEIYDRHFNGFRDQEVHVLEVGVHAGGSLDMWRNYFGPRATFYGVDILPECKAFEDKQTKIFIGDQSDRDFWRSFREKVPVLDIVIDDGSHVPNHQIVSLEELLGHLRSGGVYLCEDIHQEFNSFTTFTQGLVHKLYDFNRDVADPPERDTVLKANSFQRAVGSMHFYPQICVIERTQQPKTEYFSSRRGTQWPL